MWWYQSNLVYFSQPLAQIYYDDIIVRDNARQERKTLDAMNSARKGAITHNIIQNGNIQRKVTTIIALYSRVFSQFLNAGALAYFPGSSSEQCLSGKCSS